MHMQPTCGKVSMPIIQASRIQAKSHMLRVQQTTTQSGKMSGEASRTVKEMKHRSIYLRAMGVRPLMNPMRMGGSISMSSRGGSAGSKALDMRMSETPQSGGPRQGLSQRCRRSSTDGIPGKGNRIRSLMGGQDVLRRLQWMSDGLARARPCSTGARRLGAIVCLYAPNHIMYRHHACIADFYGHASG